MSLAGLLTSAATIISGIVSFIVIISFVVDAVTRGWVRSRARSWVGIDDLRQDHQATQVFLADLGTSYNHLSESVCEDADVHDPPKVDVEKYDRIMTNGGVERGDFIVDD